MLWVKGIASQELVSTTISSILGTSEISRAVRIETPAPRGAAANGTGVTRVTERGDVARALTREGVSRRRLSRDRAAT
jgi:hypothetical protein